MSMVLDIRDLKVNFRQDGRVIHAVKGVSFTVDKGETVALVGESGSGKSVTALATVALLGGNAEVAGSVKYLGREMIGAPEPVLRDVRGNDISFIFQEPMTSLNPLHTLEKQLAESLSLHQGLSGEAARARIIELMDKVGIDNPERRLADYPHQLSGGQRQRVMIAMALANGPELLIADEPTTALDVTIQAQILDLLAELKERENLSLLFISPRPRHRAAYRRPGLRDAGRRDRRAGTGRGDLRQPAASLYAEASGRGAAWPARSGGRGRGRDRADGGSADLVPDPARACCARPSAM